MAFSRIAEATVGVQDHKLVRQPQRTGGAGADG